MAETFPFALAGTPLPRRKGYVTRPDCRLYYEVTGSGPALVFAHGLGGNHLSWWQQVAAFCGRYSCITFSHRGFAPSSAPPEGPDPAAYAGDLAALREMLEIGDFVIIGQSMGGWTALDYALAGGAGLRGMVLAATSGPIDPRPLPPFAAWKAAADEAALANQAAGIHPAIGARAAAEQPALHFLYRAIDEMSVELDKSKLRPRLMAGRTRPVAELQGIATPALWLTGAEDMVFPSPTAPLMAAAMPRARHQEIPQAGHSAYFERPTAFNAALAAFLAEIGWG
jgi:3-oxoadipate enol-lactonase